MVTGLSALAGGCSSIVITDLKQPKLDLAKSFGAVRAVNVSDEDPVRVVEELTDGWGADIVFEAVGLSTAAAQALELLKPGGTLVYVGMPPEPISFDIVKAQSKEVTIKTIFRYAHVYPRALSLMGAGKINLNPLITETYPFTQSIEAYDYAVNPKPTSVKVQIEVAR